MKDAGALPLLSYLLEDMWQHMVERGDGKLRLPAPAIEFGRVLVDRADGFLARNPNSAEMLSRIFTLKLATVREDGEPTRRLAYRSEFSDEEWRLVSELADHPNRLLVTATPETGETYVEVAHEAIFRRWDKLRQWIAAGILGLAKRRRSCAARLAGDAGGIEAGGAADGARACASARLARQAAHRHPGSRPEIHPTKPAGGRSGADCACRPSSAYWPLRLLQV